MQSSPIPEELLEGWQGVLSQWPSRLAHDTLLGRAVKYNQLAWLATRYREAARGNPHDPIARDRMRAIQRAATILAFAAKTREESSPKRRAGPALLVATVLSTGLGLWLTDYMRVQHPPAVASHASPSR
jgi:hypothetical protein